MKIAVSRGGDQYAFRILDDDGRRVFDSTRHSVLVSGARANYDSFGKAYASANRIIDGLPSCLAAIRGWDQNLGGVDNVVPAEDEIIAHFSDQIALIESRWTEVSTSEQRDKKRMVDAFLKEVDGVKKSADGVLDSVQLSDVNVVELESVRDRLGELLEKAQAAVPPHAEPPALAPQMGVVASGGEGAQPLAKEVLVAFGESAAEALESRWPGACLKRVEQDGDGDRFVVTLARGDEDICILVFNSDLFLTDVLPCCGMSGEAPLHSMRFYEECWLPVVSAVGHFFDRKSNSVVVPRCGSDNKGQAMYGFSRDDWSDVSFAINAVPLGEKAISWSLERAGQVKLAASKFTEGQLENAEVRCVKKDLPTYYGRTGKVVSVIPRADYADVVVDFMRGLGQLVLTDSDIELLDI